MKEFGFNSTTDLIACYKRYSGTGRSEAALRKAYSREEECLRQDILEFILEKNKRKIKRKVAQTYNDHKDIADKIIIPIALFLLIFFILSKVLDSRRTPINKQIKEILKAKGYNQKVFAEQLYIANYEEMSDCEYLDTEERETALRKYTSVVYKNLNDPARNSKTLQDYLEFASDLESIPR